MGLCRLDEPYDVSTWYECTGAYDLNVGTDLMLDLPRAILNSDAYFFQGVTFPKSTATVGVATDDVYVDAGATFSGVITLQPFSYLVSLTGFASNFDQFTVRVYDKGAQTDLYFRQFGWFPTMISNMQDQLNNGFQTLQQDVDMPLSPYLFRSPLVILPPGQLQIQVTNVSVFNAIPVQLLFGFAVPRTTVTMMDQKMTTAQDQTGVASLQTVNNLVPLIALEEL